MDTERLAEFGSTIVILAGIVFVALGQVGVPGLETRVLYTLAITAVPFVPIVYYLVYVGDLETYMIGPWGPEDIVFLGVVAPLLAAVVWAGDTFLAGSAFYWVLVGPGILGAIVVAVVVRSLAIGEWPPGSRTRAEREGDPSDPQ